MAGLGFAREQLEKQGWTEGKGLGKGEDGITKAIKLGVKNDTQGVGYKISDQFTFHWWDHVFNKTAKSITIDEDEDGVKVSKNDDSKYLPISNQRPSKHSEKPLLYGRFVKASSSTASTSAKSQSESDSDSDAEKDFSTEHAEDIVFKRCGGRTAHKGARHGLKLNGKLKRLEEHDKIALSEPCSRSGSPDITKEHDLAGNAADLLKKLQPKKKKEFKSYSDSEEFIKKKKKRDRGCENETSFGEEKVDRKRKKDRKDPKELRVDVNSDLGVKEKKRNNKDKFFNEEIIEEKDNNLCDVESNSAKKKKKRKNKEKEKETLEADNDNASEDLLLAESNYEKKKKKRKDKNKAASDIEESENKPTNLVEAKNEVASAKISENEEPNLINGENNLKKKKKRKEKDSESRISTEESEVTKKKKTNKRRKETNTNDEEKISTKEKKSRK